MATDAADVMREICDIGTDVVKCFSPSWYTIVYDFEMEHVTVNVGIGHI